MKQVILSVIFLLITVAGLYAAKSSGTPKAIRQPDGTTLMVRLFGDEHFSWYQTMDGIIIVHQDKAFYIAEIGNDGSTRSTGVLAHNLGSRKPQEQALAKAQDRHKFFTKGAEMSKARRKAIAGYPGNDFCPHSGNIRIPVIMVEYTDIKFTFQEKSIWEDYFNGTERFAPSNEARFKGHSSVGRYFADASFGNFTPEFDLYGIYTVTGTHDHYGYGTGNTGTIISEALSLADNDIDFSKYDYNNDGKADMVYILYAGTGANISGDDSDIWPQCYYRSNYQKDGKRINIIGLSNELAISASQNNGTALRAGIGVLCHEMSHGLGLPDLYNTAGAAPKDEHGYNDWNNCGPEDWDLMDGGENIFNGFWPVQYAAWERDIMGWTTLEELNSPADITLYPLDSNTGKGKAFRITNPANPNEYYVLENFGKDKWNEYQGRKSSTGLLITHVNDISQYGMSPNNTYKHPNLTLVPADGFLFGSYSVGETIWYNGMEQQGTKAMFEEELKGDPYPGNKDVTAVGAYKNYVGDDMTSQFPLTDIRQNEDGSVSFRFMGGESTGISNINNNTDFCTQPKKIIRNGRIVIGCHNIAGQRIK
ncbi:MAG: M6 family metalloprotease domain-containing protein [Bacteroidales bacterium]|nr:M6 family metalloprotease domain-containing protein [Bacteroidales bacterium]MCM1148147.1 M6 family metalloprotease domain-containing protein [Bacteroidales bacterium]MCM1206563.1 M6 family metalloprotease domain-containing protein [Bacillota bacterium]MCM1510535.1 M6 family metalloprotease domain-containing protein [Clostridium sp.]